MNFMEAVREMRKGKKVMRNDMITFYMCLNSNKFFEYRCIETNKLWDIGCKQSFRLMELEATDWEVVEEKKTLSDKICHIAGQGYKYYEEKDVREFLKELERDILFGKYVGEKVTKEKFRIVDKIKELAGERLI